MRSIVLYCQFSAFQHQELEARQKSTEETNNENHHANLKVQSRKRLQQFGSFLNQANTRIRCPSSFDPPLSLLSISHYLYQSSPVTRGRV